MTRRANARIAGVAYLLYIAAAYPSFVIMSKATRGDGLAAQLASLTQHANDVRLATVLGMVGGFCALALAVSLWAITRDQDSDLAMVGLTFRVAEGVVGAASLPATLALLALTTVTGANAPDAAAMQTLTAFVLKPVPQISAAFFAVGSTAFCWLLLRGRMIPAALAWLGFIGSALLVIGLPLEIAAVLHGKVTQLMWAPVAIFEVTVAIWFLAKGVAERT